MIPRTLVLVLLAGLLATASHAQVPTTLHYQASVLEDEQQVDGEIAVTARIYDVESGGQALWSEARPAVPVTEGRLSLLLGSETPFPGSLFDASPRYLEIEINGERLPRLPMASTAYALRAGVASAVAAGAVDAAALAPDAAVTSINDVRGALTVEGENGATVNVDPDTGVITISAPAGEGSGILGVQNTDGTLQVVDPNGPTATINLQDESIGSTQLADGAVEADKLDDGAVTTQKIQDQAVTAAKLAPGSVVNTITAGPGLVGSGTSGAVTLAIAENGVTAAQLAENAVTRQALAPGAAVTALAVGDDALTGPVALAAADGASLAVADGTITISAEGTGGTITGVTPGPGLAGGGTSGTVTLGIAEGGVGPAQLAPGAAVTSLSAGGEVLSGRVGLRGSPNISVSPVAGENALRIAFTGSLGGDVTSVVGVNGLTTVSGPTGDVELGVAGGGITTARLADGAVSTAKVGDGAVTEPKLAVSNAPASGRVLGYDGSALTWTAVAAGDITGVTAQGGLAGGGETGTVSVSIAGGGVTGPRLADGVIRGGPNVTVTRDASDNFVVSASSSGLTSAVESIRADGQTLDGDLTFETSGSASLSVSGNTLTFGAASGGLTSVSSNATLTGNGTSGSPLGLANNAVTEPRLDATNSAGTGQVLSYAGGGQFAWVDAASGGLSSVSTDGTLTGSGTSGNPLGVADDAITAARLAPNAVTSASVQDNSLTAADLAANAVGSSEINDGSILAADLSASGPSSGEVLGYNGSALEWTTAATGDITSVTGTGGLTGTTDSGDATVSIATGGVTGPRLADGVVQGGSNVTVTRDASDNFVVSASTSGLTSVATDGTLTGDGTSGNVLGLAAGAVAESNLDATNAPNTGQVLSYGGGDEFTWADPSATVTTDGSTLTGNGNTIPLAIQNGGVGSTQLAADVGGAMDGYVLTYDPTAAGDLAWEVSGGTTSSLRFKTNVETLEDAPGLVDRLRGVRFDWTADGRADVGLIAEEVARVLPELVTYEADGTTIRGLRYGPLVAVLIEAAKTQEDALDAATETIESQRTEIAAQRTEIDALTERLARLEALVQSLPGANPSVP